MEYSEFSDWTPAVWSVRTNKELKGNKIMGSAERLQDLYGLDSSDTMHIKCLISL